ncbi:MAG TPA: type IV toxin-antitoxin system AbiEi family antitoxin domain-containing protein [Salinivirgaceae bacterium]|nr:type IV toxin-antitoxin system AbiEi family antitoxin domain-containing protein [Salinivirgaceae bacterium]HQA75581.1 type IV toxin-antitoxin system AbiEi family antitoxin domain-containing protein [Salinivirgaceae bacterium]
MSTIKQTKINSLLQKFPQGALYFGSWMNQNGISYFLQRHYRNSQWLTAIDNGVMYRTGEKPTLYSALSCFNTQLNKNFHIGAVSALEIRGIVHYVPLGRRTVVVYCPRGEWFPKWFSKYDWGVEILRKYTEYGETGITKINENNFEVAVSSPERAFLECLDLAPKHYNLTDLYQVMEMLNGLRPNLLQQLLEECNSVKVKRLFLYMAEKANHQWYENLDLSKIDLGKGKRSIVKNGVFNSKYQITIPQDLANYE